MVSDTELYEDEDIKAIVPFGFDQDGHPVYFYIITSFRVFTLKDEVCLQVPWKCHPAVETIQ